MKNPDSKSICLYFQIHQPFRLKNNYSFFDMGVSHSYEDESANRDICRKVSGKCYIPAARMMTRLAEKSAGRFRIGLSVSGTAVEQFEKYSPETLECLKELAGTGYVEILGETYYHSLAFLFSMDEFCRQVEKHRTAMKNVFGLVPVTFRNTELIYNNDISSAAAALGFKNIIAEGSENVLAGKSPNFLYTSKTGGMNLLLKNYRLSDDIAFRFSDRGWSSWPLSPGKYTSWVTGALEKTELVNLFMDFETFGEHQWEETGIFDFFEKFVSTVITSGNISFITPGEASDRHASAGIIDAQDYSSWADRERNLSAWAGNPMQMSALRLIYRMEKDVINSRDEVLLHEWRKLQSSDHFYYMSTKGFSDGAVHRYFSWFPTPYDAYIVYTNIANDLREKTKRLPDTA